MAVEWIKPIISIAKRAGDWSAPIGRFVYRHAVAKWSIGPFKELDIRPVPELCAIPGCGDQARATLRMALRISNMSAEALMISGLQAEVPMPPEGHIGIPRLEITNPLGVSVPFPTVLPGKSTQDVLLTMPIDDNSARFLGFAFVIRLLKVNRAARIPVEIYRDVDELQVIIEWMGRDMVFGAKQLAAGATSINYKFRRKLKNKPTTAQAVIIKSEDKPPT